MMGMRVGNGVGNASKNLADASKNVGRFGDNLGQFAAEMQAIREAIEKRVEGSLPNRGNPARLDSATLILSPLASSGSVLVLKP